MKKFSRWWESAVIYQVYPRSFQDTNDDGIGDLEGITQRLPHLIDLGVDAVWISPVFRSPMNDFGYDISDYEDIDPIFGSMADFERLIEEAQSRDQGRPGLCAQPFIRPACLVRRKLRISK
jgi:alpha-glucosidase